MSNHLPDFERKLTIEFLRGEKKLRNDLMSGPHITKSSSSGRTIVDATNPTRTSVQEYYTAVLKPRPYHSRRGSIRAPQLIHHLRIERDPTLIGKILAIRTEWEPLVTPRAPGTRNVGLPFA